MNTHDTNNLEALVAAYGADVVVAALSQIEGNKADEAKRNGDAVMASRLSASADALSACSAELETYIHLPDFRDFA